VASERQTGANRRNAARSTGPRSAVGKNRTRFNALRHELTRSLFANADTAQAIEDLARVIVYGNDDFFMLVQARVLAESAVELARVRFVKIALIERVMSLGPIGPPLKMKSLAKRIGATTGQGISKKVRKSEANDKLTTVAVQRALPELIKIHRYEQRAAAHRDRALRGTFSGGSLAVTRRRGRSVRQSNGVQRNADDGTSPAKCLDEQNSEYHMRGGR
jgi:hypothetical protein